MTYIARDAVIARIPNKFEVVRVLALEARRLNDEMRAREVSVERKITTMAVENLLAGEIHYYDARERREQERSEAMLAAAEGILDAPIPEPVAVEETDEADSAPAAEPETAESVEEAPAEEEVEKKVEAKASDETEPEAEATAEEDKTGEEE